MNGERKIEIIKPFGEAFELTKRILFQPFDFTKWLVIGFAAFLSGHFSGIGFNPMHLANLQGRQSHEHIGAPDLESWKPWWPILILSFVIFIFALVVVFAWLKARGNFVLPIASCEIGAQSPNRGENIDVKATVISCLL